MESVHESGIDNYNQLEKSESYDLSPLQEGMLIHTLRDTGIGMYVSQAIFTLQGVEVEAFTRAWRILVDRHSILHYINKFQTILTDLLCGSILNAEIERAICPGSITYRNGLPRAMRARP